MSERDITIDVTDEEIRELHALGFCGAAPDTPDLRTRTYTPATGTEPIKEARLNSLVDPSPGHPCGTKALVHTPRPLFKPFRCFMAHSRSWASGAAPTPAKASGHVGSPVTATRLGFCAVFVRWGGSGPFLGCRWVAGMPLRGALEAFSRLRMVYVGVDMGLALKCRLTHVGGML